MSVLDGKWSEEGSGRPGPMPNGPSAVIVDCPIPNRHLQMAFVEGDQEVQTLATKAAAQSLAYGVRLRGSYRCPQNPYSQTGKTSVNRLREDAVPIMEDEAVGMATRERFPELLQRPFPPWDAPWRCGGEFGGIRFLRR